MNTLFKIFGGLFGVLFLFAAGLQYNDPDAFIWIIIWAFSGAIALTFTFSKIPSFIVWVGGAVALAGFFLVYPAKFEGFVIGEGTLKNVEEGRESFGFLIISIVFFTLAALKMITEKLKV